MCLRVLITLTLIVIITLIAISVTVTCELLKNNEVTNSKNETDSKPESSTVSSKLDNSDNLTSNTGTTSPTNTVLPDLCKTCNCTDYFVNCTDLGLKDIVGTFAWPKKPLGTVTVKGNQLYHIRPFPSVSIDRLVLCDNRITKIDNSAFKKIVNLTELDLSHNQLTSKVLQPHVFEGKFSPESYEPLSVTALNLAVNDLHNLNQDLFAHLPNLKILILAGNPFNVIDQHTHIAISSLAYLEELDLSFCNIDDLPDHIFHGPRHLTKLNLNGNRFTTIPRALDDAKELKYLSIGQNPIIIINGRNSFPTLPFLKELNILDMPELVEIGAGAFSRLTGLEELRVQNCHKLGKIDEDAMVQKTSEGAIWPPLKKLDLSDNALRYLPSMLVGRWERLEELDLMNNEWSCDCMNQYLIGTLLPRLGKKLMDEEVNELKCAMPTEHAGQNLTSLAHWKLRCLDLYDARPEKDAAVLIGMLIGLLLAIPLGGAIFLFWKRGFFFCVDRGPATFARAFYKRTPNDDDI